MTSAEPSNTQSAGLFSEGDIVLLIDRKGRRYMTRLDASKSFHSHNGILLHSDIIGVPDGSRVSTSGDIEFLAIRPTLEEYVLKMPRAATIVYPKDTGTFLVYGDIYPGALVVEAGVGAGALTLALLRAVGEQGRVVSYEVREEAVSNATHNVETFAPEMAERWTLHVGDVTEGIEERNVDRIILDLAEPWEVVPPALESLRDGGIFLSYVPTTIQVQRTVETLRDTGVFGMVSTVEVMQRNWEVGPNSVRPAHRMVAHTGFITVARRLQPGAEFPRTRQKSQY